MREARRIFGENQLPGARAEIHSADRDWIIPHRDRDVRVVSQLLFGEIVSLQAHGIRVGEIRGPTTLVRNFGLRDVADETNPL